MPLTLSINCRIQDLEKCCSQDQALAIPINGGGDRIRRQKDHLHLLLTNDEV